MTDYTNWKIKTSELDEKAEEYSQVAAWCNESGEYHIEDTGEYFEVVKNPEYIPTDKEIRELRAVAYAQEVDCITAHIQRLRDENPIPDGEIAELIAERAVKVKEIQERYPYDESSSD